MNSKNKLLGIGFAFFGLTALITGIIFINSPPEDSGGYLWSDSRNAFVFIIIGAMFFFEGIGIIVKGREKARKNKIKGKNMNLIYSGKTKDVYDLGRNYLLKFKDSATGSLETGKFDPGENQIIGQIEGKGKAGLAVSKFFFKKINAEGFPTHFVSCDIEKAEMVVKPAVMFGKGIEVICRFKAYGSFVRRYGDYIKEGTELDSLTEITLKDDERGDPLVTREILSALGILTAEEHDILVDLTRKISGVIKSALAEKGLELIDLKLEFGRNKDGRIMLIDEVSGDCMRVFKGGESVSPVELEKIITA
jgi:phosphoribosylaminoimidazole-succinocarboxamide synthase